MNKPPTISVDEWQAELEAVNAALAGTPDADPSWRTVREFAERWKIKRAWAQEKLQRLVDLGKAKRDVRMRRVGTLVRPTPCYKLTL